MKIKNGMGGSRCGRNRWDPTEVLKKVSKKARRSEATDEIIEQETDEDREQRLIETAAGSTC